MHTCTKKFQTTAKFVLVVTIVCFTFSGCSSVNIIASQASKADDIFSKTVFAIGWGLSDPAENADCKGEGLQFISVSSSWFYSLVTVVTLGAVVPYDVKYRCTSVSMQDGGTIGESEE